MNTPFRYDFVGSFLRPLSLKEARKQFEAGTISKQELVKVEDACIEDLIAKQKTAGYHVITDGEFRRATWHLDFFWEFNGVGHTKTKTGLPFHGEAAMIDDTYLTGKISYNNNHSFLRHFEFVNHDVEFPYLIEGLDEIYNLACPASPIHYQYDAIKTIKTSVLGAINMLGLAKKTNACFLIFDYYTQQAEEIHLCLLCYLIIYLRFLIP